MSVTSRADIQTEVAIVGGGVAGSSLGAALARANIDVVIIEREREFRDRVRGEGIHPWGVAEAEKLDLLPTLRRAGAMELSNLRQFRYGEPMGPALRLIEQTPPGFGEWTVYHPTLQNTLIDEAETHGAEILRPAKATAYDIDNGAPVLTVSGPDGECSIRARLVVAADGRLSGVRRWIGANVVRDPPDHHLVGGCLLQSGNLPGDAVHLGGGHGVMSFVFPRDDGFVRAYLAGQPEICGPIRRSKDFSSFVAEIAKTLPEGVLDSVEQVGPLALFPGTNQWADKLTDRGIVLIGDAAMATDPTVGHGLSLVFRDVRELRDLLLDGDDWQDSIEEFAHRKQVYQAPIRCSALWVTQLAIDTGTEADARRERAAKAREIDPSAGGYSGIIITGPDGLPTDDAARHRFFGEDLAAGATHGAGC